MTRCSWCGSDEAYVAYHDNEWGMPVTDDRRLFEKLSLEGFQSGLSWLTILRKRENFRAAFAGFDIAAVAAFGEPDVKRLLGDSGIVRHRGKIEAVINNARRAVELQSEFGSFSDYVWSFAGSTAQAMAKDLKKRGWSFVGPTTVYAFMQAMGLVNDHGEHCFARERVERARADIIKA